MDALVPILRAAIDKAPHPEQALDSLHVDDLALAAACARGNAAALAEFDARVLRSAVRAAARLDSASDFADEVAQAVRSRLFTVAEKGKAPRIAGYGGRASLESWTRAVALRSAATLRDGFKEERDGIDDRLARLATGDSAELDLIKAQLHQEFRTSFGEALASLPRRSRSVLRLHVVDGVTLDGLAVAYGVHRATVARWLASARSSLLKRTRARLSSLLELDAKEIDSLIEHARSRLDISIGKFLVSTSEEQ
ncbi:MAG: sigma-70 family RNA polymerase sigma factor [Deltaproteobacteria bacterium]|nr:sigma-70 family RNA polymerase sigma factor [Deltaproteobacteria bacterium]